jgi:hypothetical protein
MAMNTKLIPQHKKLAQGMELDASNSQDDFGVVPFSATHKPHSEPAGGRKGLKEHQRGIGRSIKYHPNRMPMQASPDHGDHE